MNRFDLGVGVLGQSRSWKRLTPHSIVFPPAESNEYTPEKLPQNTTSLQLIECTRMASCGWALCYVPNIRPHTHRVGPVNSPQSQQRWAGLTQWIQPQGHLEETFFHTYRSVKSTVPVVTLCYLGHIVLMRTLYESNCFLKLADI